MELANCPVVAMLVKAGRHPRLARRLALPAIASANRNPVQFPLTPNLEQLSGSTTPACFPGLRLMANNDRLPLTPFNPPLVRSQNNYRLFNILHTLRGGPCLLQTPFLLSWYFSPLLTRHLLPFRGYKSQPFSSAILWSGSLLGLPATDAPQIHSKGFSYREHPCRNHFPLGQQNPRRPPSRAQLQRRPGRPAPASPRAHPRRTLRLPLHGHVRDGAFPPLPRI